MGTLGGAFASDDRSDEKKNSTSSHPEEMLDVSKVRLSDFSVQSSAATPETIQAKIDAAAPSEKEVEQLTKGVTEAAEEQNEEYNAAFANCFDVHKGEVWIDETVENLADLNKPASKKNNKNGCSGCCLILITNLLLFLALGGYIYAEKKGLVKTDYFEALDLPIASVTTEQSEITDSIHRESLEQTERKTSKASKKSKKSKRSRLLSMAL